ncbi:MAG: hypothetical protein DRO05_06035, partial [Thermoproteota archaeon]
RRASLPLILSLLLLVIGEALRSPTLLTIGSSLLVVSSAILAPVALISLLTLVKDYLSLKAPTG